MSISSMIRVDTTGLQAAMGEKFSKITSEFDKEFIGGGTVEVKDADTGITLHQTGFESARFKNLWTEVNGVLLEKQFGKCAYCEAKMSATSQADVEHFRPKAGYDPATGGLASDELRPTGLIRSGYFWLAYSASNYYASCRICNEVYKKNKFDLLPDSPRTTYGKPAKEQPAFVDPGNEDPRAVLRFDPYTAKAVAAALWEKYVNAKGKTDPLAQAPAKQPMLTSQQDAQEQEQLQKEEQEQLGKIVDVLRMCARLICRVSSETREQHLLKDQKERAAAKELRHKAFVSDSPLLDEPYTHFSDNIPDQVTNRGTQAVGEYIVVAWLFEVHTGSPVFQRTLLVAATLRKCPEVVQSSTEFIQAARKSLILPEAQQILISDMQAKRAYYNIYNLGLNRVELVRARAEHLVKIRGLFLFCKNNGVKRKTLKEKLDAAQGKCAPSDISEEPNEINAALTSLQYSVCNAGQFASATYDALQVWMNELPDPVAAPHRILTSVNAPAEPWLAMYYKIANQPLRPDDEENEPDPDTEDVVSQNSSKKPLLEEEDSIEKFPFEQECGYFCVLQRLGVKLSTLKSRYGLSAIETDILSGQVWKRSETKDQEVEKMFLSEVKRLLQFGASPEELVQTSYVPENAKSGEAYWSEIDEKKSGGTALAEAYAAAMRDAKACKKLKVLGLNEVRAWWKQANQGTSDYPTQLKGKLKRRVK